MSYCSACSAYLCDFCSQVHQRQMQKRYKDHQLKQLKETRATTKYICDKHSEPLKVFCQTCYSLVCSECMVESHQKHVYKSVNSETRAGVDKVVGELVETARKKADDLKDKIEYMNIVEKSVIERTERLKKEVNSAYKDILAELDHSRAKIMDKIEKAGDKDLKLTWANKNSAELKSKSLNAALELAARAKKCTDIEMLRLSGQLIDTMEAFDDFSLEVDKIEEVHCTSYTLKKQQGKVSLGSITSVISAATTKYSMRVTDQLESVPLGSKCSFHVQFLPDHKECEEPLGYCLPTITQCDVSLSYGQSMKDISGEKILVEKQGRLKWKITFVPVCSGRHYVKIDLSEEEDFYIEDPVDFSFSVHGLPPINSLVQRGPDWGTKRYKTGKLAFDGGAGKIGTVKSCESSEVLVDWQAGKHDHVCRWGSKGRYDVELVSGL